MMTNDQDVTDVLVIGGGAAGLNAALVLAQAQRKVALIDAGAQRNRGAAHLHGFLSRDGMRPEDLFDIGRREIEDYGVRVRGGVVVALRRCDRHFGAVTEDRTILKARRIVLATGMTDILPEIPGVADSWGRDVLSCPYCHGWEIRSTGIAVLGSDERAARISILLTQWSPDVVLVPLATPPAFTTQHRDYLGAAGVRVTEHPVRALRHSEGRLAAVELADGTSLPCDACFVTPTPHPRLELLESLGCVLDEGTGLPRVDMTGRSSVPGCWIVGNAANPVHHLIMAAAHGASAAQAINQNLLEEDLLAKLATTPAQASAR